MTRLDVILMLIGKKHAQFRMSGMISGAVPFPWTIESGLCGCRVARHAGGGSTMPRVHCIAKGWVHA